MTTLALAVLLLATTSVFSKPISRCDISFVKDCNDIFATENQGSRVYTIYPTLTPVKVFCDQHTDGGKWTVIQRRMDGTLNFFRSWEHYKAGFGSAEGEYWLGLENIHILTLKRKHELRIDLEDFDGNKVFAKYTSFSVGPEKDGYKLVVSGFKNGGAGDSLSYHNGMKFSTFDKDQDATSGTDCAALRIGAFWYRSCEYNNINGVYLHGVTPHGHIGVTWHQWKGAKYSLKAVSMKIRPVK